MSVAKSSRQNSPVRDPLRAFDIDALHEALDAERSARGLTWTELAAEVNEPFRGMTETEEYTRDTTNMRMGMRRADIEQRLATATLAEAERLVPASRGSVEIVDSGTLRHLQRPVRLIWHAGTCRRRSASVGDATIRVPIRGSGE
jgi:hypothetical protein